MKIALQNGQIILAEIEPLRYEQLKRMGIFRWNKTTRTMTGPVSLDALNALHNRFTLPDFVETERERLAEVARQVEQQREATEPKPLAAYPVRAQMFQHQIRGANMALLQLTSGGKEQHKGFGFLFEMGCGKTLTAIATMGALYQQHRIERVLVVAPTSVCSVWPHDLQQFAAFPYHCETLLGEKKKRLEGLRHIPKHGAWPHTTKRPGQRLQGAAVYRWTLYLRDPDIENPAQIIKPPAAGTTPTAGGFYSLGYSGTISHENGNSLSASPWPFHLVW